MKKILSLFFSFLFLCGIGGCTKEKPLTETEAIQKELAEMESYACTATLTRFSAQKEQTYEIVQSCKADGAYRLELTAPENVAGNYTIFDGTRICQYNPHLNDSSVHDVPASQQRNELFLGQFFSNYMQSEGVSIATAALDEAKCVVLEAVIPGNDPALATEKLWVSRDTLLPVRFVLYDAEGKPRYQLDYHTFTFNPPLDEALFIIPA